MVYLLPANREEWGRCVVRSTAATSPESSHRVRGAGGFCPADCRHFSWKTIRRHLLAQSALNCVGLSNACRIKLWVRPARRLYAAGIAAVLVSKPVLVSNVAMKPLIAILTGLHVLAHSVFGCCDHGRVASPQTEAPCACSHAHHDDHHVRVSSSCDAHDVAAEELPSQAPHQCVHASCHWLAGSAGPSVSPPDFSAPIPFGAIPPTRDVASQSAEFRPDRAAGRSTAPPLRLHLALGVLLI